MSKKKIKLELLGFLYILSAILILTLSALNLNVTKTEVKVLGSQVEDNSEYWQDLVEKHPTYIDGWLELGRLDKVKEIDPNYFRN